MGPPELSELEAKRLDRDRIHIHILFVHISTVVHIRRIARTDAASRLLAWKSDGWLFDPTHRGQNSPFQRARTGSEWRAPVFDAGK